MDGADFARRMVIASQTYESKGRCGENGRERCWWDLGGSTVEWIEPMDAEKWYDENSYFGTRRVVIFRALGYPPDMRGINGLVGRLSGVRAYVQGAGVGNFVISRRLGCLLS